MFQTLGRVVFALYPRLTGGGHTRSTGKTDEKRQGQGSHRSRVNAIRRPGPSLRVIRPYVRASVS